MFGRVWGCIWGRHFTSSEKLVLGVACDSSETLRDLGIVFRPSAETLGDAIRWLVRAGHLNPRYAGRLGTEPASQA